jgi:hypothetical protein
MGAKEKGKVSYVIAADTGYGPVIALIVKTMCVQLYECIEHDHEARRMHGPVFL